MYYFSKDFVLSFAMVCTLLAGVNVVAFAADDNDLIVSVHSFYNDATKGGDGEHLYTKDLDEMSWLSSLPTWNDEDEAWKAPVSSSLAVYRVYNPNSGEHHYAAADEAEWLVSQGWTQEKIAFYSDDNKGVPVYRLWNGGEGVGSHYYTTDEGEAAYLASIGWTAEGVNFYGVKEEEPGEKEMTAVQTGAQEITVTTESAFTGTEDFSVLRGTVEQSVSAVVFSDNMDAAVIYLDSAIKEAEYTVICSDLDYEPATFTGEAAEVTSLEFSGEELIATNAAYTAFTFGFVTLDQFGDYIKDNTITEASITVGGANAVVLDSYEDGVGKVTATFASPVTPGTSVPASIVYAGNTKIAQTTLVASAQSVVANMIISDLQANPDIEELVGARVTPARLDYQGAYAGDYFLGIMATDQYGNALDAETLNGMVENSSLFITPNIASTHNGVAIAVPAFIDYEDVPGAVLMPVVGDGVSNGTGVINFLSTSGFSTTKNITVEPNEVIDELSVDVDALYVGQDMPVSLSAVDIYGDIVDLYSDESDYDIEVSNDGKTLTISNNNFQDVSTITATNSTFYVNPIVGSITLEANAQAGQLGVEYLTVVTASYDTSLVPVTVYPAATPDSVKGLADGVNTVLGVNQSPLVAKIDLSKPSSIVFLDSYGEVIEDSEGIDFNEAVENEYYYTVTGNGLRYTQIAGGIITLRDDVVAPTNAAKDTYTITLYDEDDNALNSATFTVTVAGEYKNYVAGIASMDPVTGDATVKPMLYTGAAGEDGAMVAVYGVDAKGNMVLLGDGYTTALKNTSVAGATLSCTSGGVITVATGVDYATYGTQTGTATVNVYVDNKVVTTATLDCSNAPAMAVELVAYEGTTADGQNYSYEAYDLSEGILAYGNEGGAIIDAFDETNTDAVCIDEAYIGTEGSSIFIVAYDQYGNAVNIGYAAVAGTLLQANTTLEDCGITENGVYDLIIAAKNYEKEINIIVVGIDE